jgi:hypothetical protein
VFSTRMGRLGVSAALLTLVLAFPMGAAATITGGCTGTGTATSGGVDLTTATEWHVKKDDVGGGSGEGPTAHNASVGAYALGLQIPIQSGHSDPGESSGSVEGVSVSTFALLGARFIVTGSADNGCAGQIEIIIDDVDPLFTLLGGGGALVAALFALLVLRTMRGGKGIFKRLLDTVYGLIGGIGAALALEQFGYIDPDSLVGLMIAIAAGVFAFLTCGILGGGKKKPAVGGSAPGPTDGPMGGKGTTDPGTQPDGTEVYPGGAVGGGGPA